jgi:sulfur relay (sulfurtransferase) complex TusBCD TusD component (DsrE family)
MGPKSILAGILFFALLRHSVQALQSVTLAWDPSPDLNVAGYNIQFGGVSGTYTNKVDAGKVTTRTISCLLEGGTYYFAAAAYATTGLESVFSNEIGYTIPLSNNLPTITLNSPANGSSYSATATINLVASVTANAHTITKVQFYSGGTWLGEDVSAPYGFSWSNPGAGSFSLTARAVYDAGSTVSSESVGIVVGLPPTRMGNTNEGTLTDAIGAGWINAGRFQATANLTASTLLAKVVAITGRYKCAIYSDNGSQPGRRLRSSAEVVNPAAGWQTFPLTAPLALTNGQFYWLGIWSDNSGAKVYYSSVTGTIRWGNYYYGTWPDPFITTGGGNANYCIYASGPAATLSAIRVTPTNSTILAGTTQQFTATGTYSDGSTQNLSSQATWITSNPTVATVNASGLVTAVSAGTTTFTAALAGVTDATTATVTANPPTIVLTLPANGANYTAPATVNFAASVTANGHSITKVQFYNGATLLGEDSSSPYSFAWSNVSAGSYSPAARAIYDAGGTVNSPSININVAGVPAPWQTTDIGSVGTVGSASLSNGVYTVKGAGNLSDTADNFRFVYQPMSGDGEIKVRLNFVENTGTSGRIGVIIRESLTSGAKYAFMGIPPDGTIRWQRRSYSGGSTSLSTTSIGTLPNIWLRLVRAGNLLYGYWSTDGTTWTLVNSRSITMATNIYFGLAVASGSSNTLNTAKFTNVTVVP